MRFSRNLAHISFKERIRLILQLTFHTASFFDLLAHNVLSKVKERQTPQKKVGLINCPLTQNFTLYAL